MKIAPSGVTPLGASSPAASSDVLPGTATSWHQRIRPQAPVNICPGTANPGSCRLISFADGGRTPSAVT
ncbi:MAG: hypothetical protein JWM19_5072 [Actinomycetia bacterium]|nr:hypothetical protein [Actinomycetes bacterium]